MEFEKLQKNIIKCKLCKEKFGFIPNPVLFGNRNAKIMQISQAPSSNVHITGKPFDDLSGKKLRNEWYQISDEEFYNKDNFYITGIGHCYPGKTEKGGDKLPPKICFDKWVKNEINLVNNTIYIIIGSKASKILFPNENFNELVFKNNYLNDKFAIVIPHPSPLNIKWFKDNPEFYNKRLPEIRKIIKEVLEEK